MFKKIISLSLVFAIIFSFAFCFVNPTNAYADFPYDALNFWDWILEHDPNLSTVLDQFMDDDFNVSSGCSHNNGGPHQWVFYHSSVLTPGIGHYTCAYCGMDRGDYVSQEYDDAMEFQGLSGHFGYNYDGNMIFYPDLYFLYNSNYIKSYSDSTGSWTISNDHVLLDLYNLNRENWNSYIYCCFPLPGTYYENLSLSFSPMGNSSARLTGFTKYTFNFPSSFQTNSTSYYKSLFSFGFCSYSDETLSIIVSGYFTFTPSDPSTAPPAQQVYTSISQIINIDYTVATIDQSQTITQVYQDITFFNPTTMIYYNPTLDLDFDVTTWRFDFDTRTYHLTLDDDTEVTLCFDDDRIIVFHGEDVYYYYYVSPTATEPTPEPSAAPTAEPTPRPTAPVGWPEDYDTDDTPMWNRLFAWLDDAKTWLGGKLDALLNKDTSVTLDPEFNIELPEVDPGFIYTDDAGEQQVWRPSALKDKFAFWKDVRDIGTELYASVQSENVSNGSSSPPELILHLGSANSNYGIDYGGDVYALDLSWYSEYKPTVDSITGGFLWLLYLYGVFKHLPEILSGVGMVDNRVEDIQSGSKGSRRRNQ